MATASKWIPYKDTNAVPGSELHKLLSEGKMKEAEKSYQETNKQQEALFAAIDAREAKKAKEQNGT
jgi:hypothetical protein